MGKKKLTNVYIKASGHVSKHEKPKKKRSISLTWIIIIFAVVVLAGWYFFMFNSSGQDGQEELYFDSASPVMYFYSESCHWCQEQKPILQELADEGYRVNPMNVGAHPEYWSQYNIAGTPTFLAGNGDRLPGFTQKDELKQFFDDHNAKIAV